MSGSILYMGDTTLDTAAAYLAGLMRLWGCEFEYVASDERLTPGHLEQVRSLFIFSDYPAACASEELQERIVQHVASGAGLLMIGGWESFHGLGGDWDGTPISGILPVDIAKTDDRLNCDHPVFVRSTEPHAISDGLPWTERPPLIGGLNRTTARSSATIVLTAEHYRAELRGGGVELSPEGSDPLLVVDQHGSGRTAALMTDVAPHWVGPLVDWGPDRVTGEIPGVAEVEVGSDYARFLRQLVAWAAGPG